MTTPNIEELIAKLRTSMGDLDCPNSYEFVMHQAAEALQSQAERIAELDEKSGALERLLSDASATNVMLAKKLDTLTAWADSLQNKCVALIAERDTLRAQLAAIAATEPVAWRYKINATVYWQFTSSQLVEKMEETVVEPLFTRPMPVLNPVWCNGDEPLVGGGLIRQGRVDVQIRTALSKYKGAK